MAFETPTAVKNSNGNPVAEATRDGTCFTPRVDIFETEAELFLFADMPGALPHEIDLRYEQGELILHGKVAPQTREGRVIFGEYDVGDFYRVFQVHESVDASKIEADFKNGVLKVRLPKQASALPKKVPIKINA
jgi:HSP20 family molecular chaperone IbpA